MDAEMKACGIVIGLLVLCLSALIGFGIYSGHVEQLACIESGGQVVSGNCLTKAAP